MYTKELIQRAVAHQKRSYYLLQWINRSLQKGVVAFDVIHESMSMWDAATDWITRYVDQIPLDGRPEQMTEIADYSRLFASYLTASFDLIEHPRERAVTSCGCTCSYCMWFTQGNHLKPKKLHSRDHRKARETKQVVLRQIARDIELPLSDAIEHDLLDHRHHALMTTQVTYGHRLVQRMKTGSGRPVDLALWRNMAWEHGAPKGTFELSPDQLLDAQQHVIEYIRTHAATRHV